MILCSFCNKIITTATINCIKCGCCARTCMEDNPENIINLKFKKNLKKMCRKLFCKSIMTVRDKIRNKKNESKIIRKIFICNIEDTHAKILINLKKNREQIFTPHDLQILKAKLK